MSHDPATFNRFRIEQQSLRFRRLEKELEDQQAISAGLQQAYQDVVGTLQRVKEDNESLKGELNQLEQRMMSTSNLRPNMYVKLFQNVVILLDNNFCSQALRDMPVKLDYSASSSDPTESLSQFANTPASVASLRLELKDLQRRYDSLLEAKEKAAARYKSDYKKWKDFKKEIHKQLMRDGKHGYVSGRSFAKRREHDEKAMDPTCTFPR